MNFPFSDASPEFGDSKPKPRRIGQPLRVLPPDSEAASPEMAIVSALGAGNIELEWTETPRMWGRLIEQADVCLEHARIAEKSLKFSAACGLILTAQELLRRSLSIDCTTTEHLALERAVIGRLDASRRDLDRLLDLAVQVRMFAV